MVKVRFAPSPTGKIHVGNVRAALWNWLFARAQNGQFMLRIDDTDQERSTPEFEAGIREDLAWLGLTHDEEGRQSARFDLYDAATQKLKDAGLLYPCYESAEELDRKRKLQRARSLPPVYDRAALALSDDERAALEAQGRKPHWRFKLSHETVTWTDLIRGETSVDTASVSDPVLIRADGMYLYTLPSCVDDIDFNITHVMRGEDHVTNTGVQIEIFKALGGTPPIFAHHSLLVGADGEGLSKRLGSLSIAAMREQGLEPSSITSLLARLGTSDPVVPAASIDALVEGFDITRLGRAPARFDMKELEGLNAKILQDMPFESLEPRLTPLGVDAQIWAVVRENIDALEDAGLWAQVVRAQIDPVIEDATFTTKAAELLPTGPYTDQSWGEFTGALKEATGAKGKALFMPLRLALTGQRHGPDMAAMFALIGEEKARARLSGQRA